MEVRAMEKPIRRPARSHPFLYLYRLQSPALWFCVVPYLDAEGKRKVRRKNFRDRKYGGKSSAFSAAKAWRDDQLTLSHVRAAMGDQRPLELFTKVSTSTPFGLVGIRPVQRGKASDWNITVTAQQGKKSSYSMRRYGIWGAYEHAVAQRCEWIGADPPDRDDLKIRFNRWLEKNRHLLDQYDLDTL